MDSEQKLLLGTFACALLGCIAGPFFIATGHPHLGFVWSMGGGGGVVGSLWVLSVFHAEQRRAFWFLAFIFHLFVFSLIGTSASFLSQTWGKKDNESSVDVHKDVSSDVSSDDEPCPEEHLRMCVWVHEE